MEEQVPISAKRNLVLDFAFLNFHSFAMCNPRDMQERERLTDKISSPVTGIFFYNLELLHVSTSDVNRLLKQAGFHLLSFIKNHK